MSESDLVLDLSKADDSGFDAMEAGTYAATIVKAETSATKGGPEAKLPAGTPKLKFQFRIEDPNKPEYTNRRCFYELITKPPAKIDGKTYEHAARMQGMLVNFLEAIGYTKEEIKSGNFTIDTQDMEGRACRVTLKREPKYGSRPEDNEWDNKVVGVKPPLASEGGLE